MLCFKVLGFHPWHPKYMYGFLKQHMQCSSTQCDASASNPSGLVLCNPFKWDVLLSIISGRKSGCVHVCVCALCMCIKKPQRLKSCRRHTQCSSTLCWWLYTQPIWCYPLQPFEQPFHMRYFVVHSRSKACCFPPSTTEKWISKYTHTCQLVSAALKHQPTISTLLLLR